MIKALVEKQLFNYDELSNKVKAELYDDYYMIHSEAAMEYFNEEVQRKLDRLFNDHNLKLQYDFSGCQGSGSNLYGGVDAIEVLNKLELNKTTYDKMLYLINEYGDKYIELDCNNHYCYCIIDRLTYFDNLLYQVYDDESIPDEEENIIQGVVELVHDKTIAYLELLNDDFYELGTNLLDYPEDNFRDNIEGLLFTVTGDIYEPHEIVYEVK